MQLGFEIGSPFMRLARRVSIAARGALDFDLFWDSQGYRETAPSITTTATLRVELARGLGFTSRFAIGVSPGGLVLDGGVGLQYTR